MFQNLARKPTGWRPTLRRPMLAAIPAVAIVAAVAAAGGTASAGTRAHASPKLTSLSIEDVPFYANAPLALGQKVGIFKHYGLTVSLQTASNVNVILADLHSGLSQLGFATTPLVLNADEAGQDVRCVAPMGPANAVNPAFPQNAVMVAKDSNITSLSQLQGKTVGLNQLAGSNELYLQVGVQKAGGTFSSVKLATVPFADQAAALASGSIQAAFEVPPFIQQGEAAGDQKLLVDLDSVTAPDTTECYVATDGYIGSHKSVIKRFAEAEDQAILYSRAHPAQMKAMISPVSGLSQSSALALVPPKILLTDSLAPASMIDYQNLMVQAKALNGNPLTAKEFTYVAPGTPMKKLLFNKSGKFTG